MHTPIDTQTGWSLLALYGLAMTGIVWLMTKREQTAEQHLVADRAVGSWSGAFSMAVTWIWAPAIFVCSQKSYEQGLAGIFWFTLPNIVCFLTFVPVALKVRRMMPSCYSLPDLIWQRFGGDRPSHLAFLLIVLGTTLTGIISNSLAGGLLMHSLAGTDQTQTIAAFAAIALFYSIWRGLPASIVTDVIQMALILVVAFVLVPWTVLAAGGLSSLTPGISGLHGSANILDPWILYSFGLPATIGLISGPICDQMFYQRAMAAKQDAIRATFIKGGLLFGLVPITLCLFGFIAANPLYASSLQADDPQLIAVRVVEHFLPHWTLYGFAIMVLCGLSSTLDSAYCSAGSLFSVDVYRRYINPSATDNQMLRASQFGMLVIGCAGTFIAILPGVKLLWIFLIYGTLAAAGLFPALLSLYWPTVTARATFIGVTMAIAFGLPLSIYANVTESPHLIVLSTLGTAALGLLVTFAVSCAHKRHAKAARSRLVVEETRVDRRPQSSPETVGVRRSSQR